MTDAEKKEYLPQIEATLKRGKYHCLDSKKIYTLYFLLVGLYLAVLVLAITCISVILAGNPNLIWYIILAVGIFLVLQLLFFLCLRYYKKEIKKVSEWLDDAVLATATSKQIASKEIDWMDTMFSTPAVKIKVFFKFDDKTYSYESSERHPGGESSDGCSYFWRRYVDKEVKILYSPKYEEVMILKEPKNK